MKLKGKAIVVCIFLQMMTGCAHTTKDMESDEIIIPENLIVAVPASIENERTTARIYEAEYWELSLETAQDLLLKGNIIETDIAAVGTAYIAETTEKEEYLMLCDGGKAFYGDIDHSYGGFYYHTTVEGIIEYETVIPYSSPFVHLSSNSISGETNEGYGKEDLDFQTYSAAQAEMLTLFSDMGLDMNVVEGYTIDLETQMQKYLNDENSLEKPSTEGYLFLWEQVLDGIPFIPYTWNTGKDRNGRYVPGQTIFSFQTENGLSNLFANGLLRVIDEGKKVNLISYEEAYIRILKELGSGHFANEATLGEGNLYYVGLTEDEAWKYKLVPAWCFRLCRNVMEGEERNEECRVWIEYYVIDAQTGEWLMH